MNDMKIGVLNQTIAANGRDTADVLEKWVEIGMLAEELGFWSMWTTEHHFATDGTYQPYGVSSEEWPLTHYDTVPDSLTALTYLAARTRDLRLATGVKVLPWDDPIRSTERAAMLDVFSQGRLEFGVGKGLGFLETGLWDVPGGAEATKKFREALEVVRLAWTGETFSYEGDYYQYSDLRIRPAGYQAEAPLFIGSASDESAAWAGHNGLAYATIPWPLTDLEVFRHRREVYLEAAAEAGADVSDKRLPHLFYMHCTPSDDEAQAVAAERMRFFQLTNEAHYEYNRRGQAQRNSDRVKAMGDGGDPLDSVDRLAKMVVDTHVVGSPASCRERLQNLRKNLNLNYVVLIVGFGGMPYEQTVASMRLFAEEVLPAFAVDGVADPATA